MKLYKIVSTEFGPLHGGKGTWFPPRGAKPGKWMPKIEDVKACKRGYHVIPTKAIVEWLPPLRVAGYLCEAEGYGSSDKDGDKIAFAEARLLKIVGVLDEKSMRLAAADMAERVLPIFYKVFPKDKRPAQAIQAARDFANGKIDDAARSAAGDAAGDAARSAARSAAWTAAGDAAGYAAWTAAGDAAWTAARSAAWTAAGDAAGYAARSAAWTAAGDAAGDAAGYAARSAAWTAAGDAAGDAAWTAAGDAAGDAARSAARSAAWTAAGDAAGDANAKIIIAQAKARMKELAK
jgi:hypothetical protein